MNMTHNQDILFSLLAFQPPALPRIPDIVSPARTNERPSITSAESRQERILRYIARTRFSWLE